MCKDFSGERKKAGYVSATTFALHDVEEEKDYIFSITMKI